MSQATKHAPDMFGFDFLQRANDSAVELDEVLKRAAFLDGVHAMCENHEQKVTVSK